MSLRKSLLQEDDVTSKFLNVHLQYIYIYICVCVCVPYHSKKVKEYIKNTLQIVAVSIINLIDRVHQIVLKILIFLQTMAINSNLTAKMDSSYLKTWKKWYHT